MPQQTTRSELAQFLCILVGIVLVATTPAVADEVPATDGGTTTDCTDLEAATYDAIDAVEASDSIDSVDGETDVLRQIQDIVTQLNYDMSRAQCTAEK